MGGAQRMEHFANKRPTIRWVAAITAVVAGAALIVVYLQEILGILSTLLDAAKPLVIGAVLAYIINLIMTRYEHIWFPKSQNKLVKRTRRGICLVLAILTVTAVAVLLIVLIVTEFRNAASAIAAGLGESVNMLIEFFATIPGLEDLNLDEGLQSIYSTIVGYLGSASDTLSSILSASINVVQLVASVVLGMIYVLYVLLDKERIIRGAKRLVSLIPNTRVSSYVMHVGTVANGCFSRFIFGQCLEACILGTLCAVLGKIIGFPYAVSIGVVVGATSIIPYLGAWIGGIVGAIMIMSVDPIQAVQFVVFLVILQQIEGHLIYPNVVGTAVQLPSVWVFSAVVVGGSLFGILGILGSVPVVSTLRTLWMEYLAERDAKEALAAAQAADAAEAAEAADAAADGPAAEQGERAVES